MDTIWLFILVRLRLLSTGHRRTASAAPASAGASAGGASTGGGFGLCFGAAGSVGTSCVGLFLLPGGLPRRFGSGASSAASCAASGAAQPASPAFAPAAAHALRAQRSAVCAPSPRFSAEQCVLDTRSSLFRGFPKRPCPAKDSKSKTLCAGVWLACAGLNGDVKFLLLRLLEHSQLIRNLACGHRRKLTGAPRRSRPRLKELYPSKPGWPDTTLLIGHSKRMAVNAAANRALAHKQIQVRPDERSLLLFAFQGKLYHYRVCHFGGRFSAYWWQRAGAFLLRQVHGLLAWQPHKAFLFHAFHPAAISEIFK